MDNYIHMSIFFGRNFRHLTKSRIVNKNISKIKGHQL